MMLRLNKWKVDLVQSSKGEGLVKGSQASTLSQPPKELYFGNYLVLKMGGYIFFN